MAYLKKILCLAFLLLIQLPAFASQDAIVIQIDGAIGPAIADHTCRAIENHQNDASLVIIEMDTPGGLDYSMRSIIKSILSSNIPVVSYVHPSGSRAASAGTYILYASHVAAMSPGTNLGAASPVALGSKIDTTQTPSGNKQDKEDKDKDKQNDIFDMFSAKKSDDTMKKKITNDAIAYIKSLAQLRNRNAEWAIKAVSDAATLTAEDAKEKNVIDVIAEDFADLLIKIDGRKVSVNGKTIEINSKDLKIKRIEKDSRTKFLSMITNPSIAYMLLMLGVYGIFLEFLHPGTMVSGVIGAIAILLALYALQLLPINYAGLLLILLGIIFMIIESFMPSFGIFGIGGAVAFIAGSILLFDTDLPEFKVAWPIIAIMSTFNLGIFTFIMGMAIRAHSRKAVTGQEQLMETLGTTLEVIDKSGYARFAGERWMVSSKVKINKGAKVRIIRIEGLVLHVEPVDDL